MSHGKKSLEQDPGAKGDRRSTEAPGAEQSKRKYWSATRKMEVVLRLLRGEDLDIVAREVGVAAHTLASWQDRFLEAGTLGLKSRRGDPLLEENARLKAKVGELTMANELLYEKIDRLEAGFSPPLRRPRR